MVALRRAAPDVAAALALALALAILFGQTFPDYDGMYALVWGRDLIHGRQPELELAFAPAAHPLYTAAAALAALFGDAGAAIFRCLGLVAFGALGVGVFRLGAELHSRAVGLAAAAILLTREPTLYLADRAFVDVLAAALVVWAAVLEARRPRRGTAVLILLALAGLLRPEAWLFAAAYWLWIARGAGWSQRLHAAALVAAGPVLWSLWELGVSGDPLRPFHEKNASVEAVGSRTGLGAVPHELAHDLGNYLQAPVLLAAVAGGVIVAIVLRARGALLIALAALNGVAFAVLAASGEPLEQRYLIVAAASLAVLAGMGIFGWTVLEETSLLRTRWRAAGLAVLAVLLAVSIPRDVDRVRDLRERVRLGARLQRELRDVVRASPARAALAGGSPRYVLTPRPVPFIAWWAHLRPSDLVSGATPPGASAGTLVAPRTPVAARLLTASLPDLDMRGPIPPPAPPGWVRLAAGRDWTVLSGFAGIQSRVRHR